MDVPITPQRRLWGDYLCGMKHEGDSLSKFLRREDVRIIRRMKTSRREGCYWFLFKDYAWFRELENKDVLTQNAFEFLRAHGFVEVSQPKDEDIVVYYFSSAQNGQVNHYGRYSKGKVVSKFGMENVYEHDLCSIPDTFGDKATFLRIV